MVLSHASPTACSSSLKRVFVAAMNVFVDLQLEGRAQHHQWHQLKPVARTATRALWPHLNASRTAGLTMGLSASRSPCMNSFCTARQKPAELSSRVYTCSSALVQQMTDRCLGGRGLLDVHTALHNNPPLHARRRDGPWQARFAVRQVSRLSLAPLVATQACTDPAETPDASCMSQYTALRTHVEGVLGVFEKFIQLEVHLDPLLHEHRCQHALSAARGLFCSAWRYAAWHHA